METLIYIISLVLTVSWSIWLFLVWTSKAGLDDTVYLRYFLLFLPALYFILVTASGWSQVVFLRVDILGLFFLDFILLLSFLIQVICIFLPQTSYRSLFIIVSICNQIVSILIVVTVYVLKLYPLIAFRLSTLLESLTRVDFLNGLWNLLDPETGIQNFMNVFNKVLIALFTYIPLTAVRMWYTSKKFRQLKEEIDNLNLRLSCIDKDKSIES